MRHVVHRDSKAIDNVGPVCLRMTLSLVAALLLVLCTVALVPTAAKAIDDTSGVEPMEGNDTELAPNGTTEVATEGASGSGGGRASGQLTTNGEEASEDDPNATRNLGVESAATQMVFKDGVPQPVFKYSNPRAEVYTNANSELWRFCVYVESDYDTDRDGKCDLIKAYVQVPRAAVQSGAGGWKAPVLYEARPYNGGMATDLHGLLGFGSPELNDEALSRKPDKRQPTSTMTTATLALDTTRSNKQAWDYDLPKVGVHLPENFNFYDYYLVRGYAIVQTAGPGSYGSEGLVCTGTQMERDAFAGVVEWICGKRAAFADKEGTISVSASDWASGKVGMIGHSYSGSVAYEVATTGVDGLKTIVPEAGPSSWYGYVNSQGICIEKSKSYDYMNFIAATCASRLVDRDAEGSAYETVAGRYKQYRSFVRNQQVQLQGDFGPFWEAREWSTKTDNIKASALIVAGLNDDNVTMKHADYLRNAFLASEQNAKVILHQGNHELPFDQDDGADLGMGKHTYAEWVNLWLAHELCGVSNDVDSMSDFLVQSNVDGSFYESDVWNNDTSITMRPNGGGEVTVSAKGASYDNGNLLQKTFTGKSSENAALWTYDAREQFTIAGKTPVHVRAKVNNVGEGDKMMSAVLVDAADAPFATYAMGARPNAETVRERDESKGPADAYSTVAWKQKQASRKIVTFGRMDLRNPEAGYEPASATRRDEPIKANTYYDYTIWLDPTYYTVQAGHHLELYIVPFCGFSEQADLAGEDAVLLSAEASDGAAMNLNQDYVITIQNDKCSAIVPTTKMVSSPVSLTGSGHVQTYGNVSATKTSDGIVIGTTGEAKRLEQFCVSLPEDVNGGIEYRAHLQRIGWGDWVQGGKPCGTTGEARRLEAVQMRLTGELAKTHSVWYRVHSRTWGWLGWAHDGEQAAGTSGQGKRGEAVEVQVLPKGWTPTDYVAGQASYVGAAVADVHLQKIGWTGNASALAFGTTGQARRLEAIRLWTGGQPVAGGIRYEVHLQRKGWMPAEADGAIAGTTGEARRLEAVKLSLTPGSELAGSYSVWYRVHSQAYGWLGWAKDGVPAGTTGLAKRAEAIEVQILPQGQVPNGYDASKEACIAG